MNKKIAIFSTHPIQYYSPLYRELAKRSGYDLTVYYSFQNSHINQASAGFGIGFDWDVPLLDGYRSIFLKNVSEKPSSQNYYGCDTPEVEDIICRGQFHGVVVHGWYTKSFRQTIRACKHTKTPVFVRGDSTLLSGYSFLKSLVKSITHPRLISNFDGYLIVGQRAKEYYLRYGANPSRMISSPHFVDNRFFQSRAEALPEEKNLRRRFGIPESSIVFLFCGKFVAIKRPLDFVRAISIASKSQKNICGIMVGDGPLRSKIESEIQSSNVNIHLAGFQNQSEIPFSYASSDVLVLCSESESWGLVVNEAMACGRPAIVSSRVGCSPDLIIPDKTGYEFKKGNPAHLAEFMLKFAENRDTVQRMGRLAQEHIQSYSASAAADGLCQIVDKFGR